MKGSRDGGHAVLSRLDAVLDHVAVAVPPDGRADRWWGGELGAGSVSRGANGMFTARQYRLGGGGKLELLSPDPADPSERNFVRAFLARFGTAVHHVTLKVADLPAALGVLEAAGLDVVDVALDHPHWREAFLRPKQVGGLVVQVAWSDGGDEEWARRSGHPLTAPAPGAPVLLGPRLRHPDLAAARQLWTALGAQVSQEDQGLRCRWPASPLGVEVVAGAPAGPVGLRMSGIGPRPAEDGVSPAILR